ncbi:semaphorin-7A isoform X2 [Onychostoma macrolepis]|uniref:semaphorin-7A isoform X2 n=1 Tax=Onychostoma macrolepis TaxID=369639 RepID=UPI00272AEB75|nr:semaphorin-7A isoform X2 [Onychostoma macrolepis]
MDLRLFCVLFICISYVSSSKLHYDARVMVNKEGITRFSFENNNINLVKLVRTSGNNIIWVGGPKILYSISPTQASKPHQVNVPLCQDESKDSDKSHCSHRISVLREGVDGNLLFICRSYDGNTVCCNLNSSYSLDNCFTSDNYVLYINEPSLLVGNMLYFTKPDEGLFRINNNKHDNIWSQPSQAEQTYLKLIAGKGQHKDKVYSFFAEKHKSKDDESERWIPRVSQSCTNDRGGSKSLLQSSWTSVIYTRLFCGRGNEFTQMIDVATLDTDGDTKIYALFRNYWNMSAVCVYNMTEISRIFTSSEFNSDKVPANHRPGTCVEDSTRLSSEVLGFMKERPEMKDWVMPENGPLLFRHRHYTHIQVDRVQDHTVLLLSLESGGVHKVLEEPVFVIAEYLPFPRGTHITSMLLDASERRLYVSSSNEVVQIDLQRCHVYGDECIGCILSRDPYCGWDRLHCTSRAKNPVQDIRNCEPEAALSKTGISDKPPVDHISPSSKHFLLCPVTSRHATYHWYHGKTREECVHSDQGCLYLIDSMNETHEGEYICVSSEEGFQRTVTQYKLSMSRSDALRLTPALLLLLTALLLTF